MNLYRPNVATLCSIGDLNRGVFLACVRKDNRAIQTVQGGSSLIVVVVVKPILLLEFLQPSVKVSGLVELALSVDAA